LVFIQLKISLLKSLHTYLHTFAGFFLRLDS